MATLICEVVKEYVVDVDKLESPVRGRIVRYKDQPDGRDWYRWSISHHFQPSAGAMPYFPSSVTAESFETAEQLFKAYAANFTAEHKVVRNEHF